MLLLIKLGNVNVPTLNVLDTIPLNGVDARKRFKCVQIFLKAKIPVPLELLSVLVYTHNPSVTASRTACSGSKGWEQSVTLRVQALCKSLKSLGRKTLLALNTQVIVLVILYLVLVCSSSSCPVLYKTSTGVFFRTRHGTYSTAQTLTGISLVFGIQETLGQKKNAAGFPSSVCKSMNTKTRKPNGDSVSITA